jgi:RNA polymerase sigma-70 factor (ECF subfamily)
LATSIVRMTSRAECGRRTVTRDGILVRVRETHGAEQVDHLTLARHGDETAFCHLYRALTPELLRYAAVLAGQDAEDVVADTWLQLSRDLHRFQGDQAAFRRFALTVTRNRARDLMRHRKRRVQETSLPLTELPEPGLAGTGGRHHGRDVAEIVGSRLSEREAVARIARLPRTQAEAVLLRVVLDMDNRSAAAVLGRRPGSVAAALSRGLRRLATMARASGYGEEVRTPCGNGTSKKPNSGD